MIVTRRTGCQSSAPPPPRSAAGRRRWQARAVRGRLPEYQADPGPPGCAERVVAESCSRAEGTTPRGWAPVHGGAGIDFGLAVSRRRSPLQGSSPGSGPFQLAEVPSATQVIERTNPATEPAEGSPASEALLRTLWMRLRKGSRTVYWLLPCCYRAGAAACDSGRRFGWCAVACTATRSGGAHDDRRL